MKQQGIVHIVGVDLEEGLAKIDTPQTALPNCAAIIGTSRFLKTFSQEGRLPDSCELISITPLEEAFDAIKGYNQKGSDVVVLASGDPLFFGIARKLRELVGVEKIKVHPAVSSIQIAFARFGIPWDDANFISLHGRTDKNYLGKILSSPKTAILTDGTHRADVIASEMCSFLGTEQEQFTLHIVENIGLESERIFSGSPEKVSGESFDSLSVVIVRRNGCSEKALAAESSKYPFSFGLKEQDIEHSRGLITKQEIRAAALHLLQIPDNSILWDVGAGSGSVGLEAARMHPDALIYSIEKNLEQQQNILANKSKFDLVNLKLIKGDAPSSLDGLPEPDRVFIGGSGGNLSDIISFCNKSLREQGVMIVTAVLDKTRKIAPDVMYKCGLDVEMHTISVSRSKYPESAQTALNPITIIVGKKASKDKISD